MTTSAPSPDLALFRPEPFEWVDLGYGYLDYCAEGPEGLVLGGWMLRLDGAFDSYELVVDGKTRRPVEVVERAALAEFYPHIPDAERGGFVAIVPPDVVTPGTGASVVVLGMRAGLPAARMGFDYRPPADLPFPPEDVMRRATGNAATAFWLATGAKDGGDFHRLVGRWRDPSTIGRLLEWGCGAGRLSRHLIERFDRSEVFGCDIDHEAAAWSDRHLNGTFVGTETDPPLPYEDGGFDLVVGLSVFTHLTHDYQERWLAELERVLAPGGLLLVTTHGTFAARWLYPNADDLERLFATGFHDSIRDEGLGKVASGDYYKSTFQTEAYTRAFWGRRFDVLEFVEGGCHNLQDIWLLRRR
ncbi:MAG: class I SAM-dependent methyltransferase [Planctomycetota bacterium JB042]